MQVSHQKTKIKGDVYVNCHTSYKIYTCILWLIILMGTTSLDCFFFFFFFFSSLLSQ